MKIQHSLVFAFLLFFAPLAVNAQQPASQCGIIEMTEQFFHEHPEEVPIAEEATERLERETALYNRTKHLRAEPELYVVPVVMHIIHDNGPENISDAQAINAIQVMNDDFNGRNSDTNVVVQAFQDVIGVANIEFRLARLDPNGQPTTGIMRYEDVATHSADDGVKTGRQWPREKYLNIYVAENLANGAAGYSRYPGNVAGAGGAAIDGIVILHDYTGQIGTSTPARRTLTHEAGHWLNLRHVWGNSNDAGLASNCNDDDLVFDTPNTTGWQSCTTTSESCGSLDNVQNYMDYSGCRHMFTQGQADRMRAAMESATASRSNLTTPANLAATGVDQLSFADFTTDFPTVCAGTPVFFRNLSEYGGETFSWSFSGPEVLTSSERYPIISFDEPGVYDVDLTVSKGAIQLSESKQGYVVVVESPGDIPPLQEDFENATFTIDWIPVNPDQDHAWELSTDAALSGTTAAKLSNFGAPAGLTDELVSRAYDLSIMDNATLSFKYAYAQTNGASEDRMLLYISNNCGENWIIKAGLQGDLLASAPMDSMPFVPTDTSEWREMSVSISSSFMVQNFRFKIGFVSGDGNNAYVDDVNLSGTFATIPTLIEPFDGGTAYTNGTQLDWTAVAFADGYQWQLDTTPAFNSPFRRTSSTTAIDNSSENEDTRANMGFLPEQYTYYWRVRSLENGFGGLWSETWAFTADFVAGTGPRPEAAHALNVFPNPTTEQVTVAFALDQSEMATVRLLDITGREVLLAHKGFLGQGEQRHKVDVSALPAGLYLAQVQLEQQTLVQRLIVR